MKKHEKSNSGNFKMNGINLFLCLGLVYFGLNFSIFSEPFGKNANLKDLNLINFEDQYGNQDKVTDRDQYLIFTADMEASKIVHELFNSKGDAFLRENGIFLISDIHKMPALITKFIALPRMQKYPYIIHLIKDENTGKNFSFEKGKLTVYKIKNFNVIEIKYVSSISDLEKIFHEPVKSK